MAKHDKYLLKSHMMAHAQKKFKIVLSPIAKPVCLMSICVDEILLLNVMTNIESVLFQTRWMKKLLARRRWHRWYNAVRATQRIRKLSATSARHLQNWFTLLSLYQQSLYCPQISNYYPFLVCLSVHQLPHFLTTIKLTVWHILIWIRYLSQYFWIHSCFVFR